MHAGSSAIAGATWFKSSYSGAEHSECVEAAFILGVTAVRDSKRPDGPRLTFPRAVWAGFLDALHDGQL
ncbi:DUF397 domain-containing protein [Streptomyces sp. SYSU K217416]